jgi:hypothetical protein
MSREFAEDVLAVAAEQGADGQGSRGLLGYLVRLATDAGNFTFGLSLYGPDSGCRYEGGQTKDAGSDAISKVMPGSGNQGGFRAAGTDQRVIIDEITRASVDGGRDAVGRYLLGLSDDPVYAEFSLEAKCYRPAWADKLTKKCGQTGILSFFLAARTLRTF